MSSLTSKLMQRYYERQGHPYRFFEREVERILHEGARVVLDAGCGRSAPVLEKLRAQPCLPIGMDVVDFKNPHADGIHLIQADIHKIPLGEETVECVFSRSVFEHLAAPEKVYAEIYRILKKGGRLVFLTANMWDYGTLIARLIPNSMHGKLVKIIEGREEDDTFPTFYRTNTYTTIKRLAEVSGFKIEKFEYLSQYPNYLMFNGYLFFLGTCYEHLIRKLHRLRFLRGWILAVLRKP